MGGAYAPLWYRAMREVASRGGARGGMDRGYVVGAVAFDGLFPMRRASLHANLDHMSTQEPDSGAGGESGVVGKPDGTRPLRSWLIGVFGGAEERGRWRLGRRLSILAIFGGVKLDLGQAQIEAPEPRIVIFAFLGGVEISAPPGLPIALSGFSLLGGKSDERPPAPPLPDARPVRVQAWAVLGGVKIK